MKRLLFVHLFAAISVLVSALDSGDFEFSERTEDKMERILYSITSCSESGQTAVESRECRMIGIFTSDEQQRIWVDEELDTQLWETTDKQAETTVTCKRNGDKILMGAGKIIEMNRDLPWYQTLFSLTPFVLGNEDKLRFYTLSANFDEQLAKGKGIQPMRFVAKKRGTEQVDVDGRSVQAMRVEITFDDLRSIFWKANYWYRCSDGMLVKYSSVRGGPGTPPTVGTLVNENNREGI